MREKARIHRILSLLEMIWQQQPDVRFNQLIANLQKLYSRQNNDYGKKKVTEKWDSGEVESSYLDFFYLEDTEWESFLKSLVENEKVDKEVARNLGTALEEYSAGQYMTFDEILKFYDAVTLNSQFITAILLEECTHFYIEENDEERLSPLNLINNKLYELHYDSDEDDYYVVNEKGEYCYSVDTVVHVKMLKLVD